MSTIPTLTAAQLLNAAITQYAAEAATPANTAPGSTMGAIFEATVLLALQLQQQAIYLDAISRLATSTGDDIDSFVTPFGIEREGATYSAGRVVVTYPSNVLSDTLIQSGVIFQTQSGLQFRVINDPSNPQFSQTAGGYLVLAGTNTVSVTVNCVNPGTIGNVNANTITVIFVSSGSPAVPGSPTVTNPLAFADALDEESDDALKARFTLTVSSGRVATLTAIGAAILGVQSGLTYTIGDQMNADGSPHPGFFAAIVNVNGTGNTAPGITLLNEVTAAIDAVRALGISYSVTAPTAVPAAVAGAVKIAPGSDGPTVIAACTAALATYINNIGLNPAGGPTTLSYGYLFVILFGVPGVADVTNLTLNTNNVDLIATFAQQFIAGTITLNAV